MEEEKKEIAPEVIERARMMGHVPKEEFKGDPSKWIPEDVFVERADNLMPILKATNKRYEDDIRSLQKQVKDQADTMERMVNIQNKYNENFSQTRKAEIAAKKEQAIEENDLRTYDALTKEEQSLPQTEKVEFKKPESSGTTEVFNKWVSENPWFENDTDLRDYAIFQANRLEQQNGPPSPENEYEFAQKVKEKVKAAFPHKFNNPARSQMSDLDNSSTREAQETSSNGKGWNDLPDVAKSQCEKYLATIPGYTKEKYLQDYFEG